MACLSAILSWWRAPDMAKGYWIARVDVYDAEAYKSYVAANAAAFS